MGFLSLLLCTASVLGCSGISFAGSIEQRELSATDLLAEYERLAPINQTLKEGRWDVVQKGHYPKSLGIFNARNVKEVFWCGDVCPQYGSVNIIYSDVRKNDCSSIGQPLYSNFWGRRYQGCAPLISRDGHLVESGISSWSIAYDPDEVPSKGVVTEPLLFDDSSFCSNHGKKISCDGFRDGEKASVKGTKSGDAIAVLELNF